MKYNDLSLNNKVNALKISILINIQLQFKHIHWHSQSNMVNILPIVFSKILQILPMLYSYCLNYIFDIPITLFYIPIGSPVGVPIGLSMGIYAFAFECWIVKINDVHNIWGSLTPHHVCILP